ncbi:lysozyme inhibitor LprI family protein [Paraclostridium bifermentans]|uniref:lysozyme inhibitor LprI family protein n=1 Tax=Paraclostridium bifermentans TaxID=1490 RepID=UPI00359C22BA
MKKILILTTVLFMLIMTGCNNNEKDDTKSVESAQTVYCDKCGEESKEVTKFCSNCGEEAKWLAEKPDISKVKKEEAKDESKEVDNNKEESKHSYKDEYINKLNSLEEGMSDLDYLYENGVTAEMNEAEATKFGRWDNMLNEIYSLLKTQLTESEMNDLRSKQRSWIEYRDKTADRESSECGGSMAGVQYNTTMGRVTKERCYELVNTYMK